MRDARGWAHAAVDALTGSVTFISEARGDVGSNAARRDPPKPTYMDRVEVLRGNQPPDERSAAAQQFRDFRIAEQALRGYLCGGFHVCLLVSAVSGRIDPLQGWVRLVGSLYVPCRRSRLRDIQPAVYWRFALLQRGPGHRIPPPLRRKIERLLGQEPTRSDRRTAKLVGVSVDTVTRIRARLENEGMLPDTRSPRGPGPRAFVGPRLLPSLGAFMRAVRVLEPDYLRLFRVRPGVRVSLTVSYASFAKFTARWDANVDDFLAVDWGDPDALEAVPDLTTVQELVAAADRMMDHDPVRGMSILAEGGMGFDDCPACRHRKLVALAE